MTYKYPLTKIVVEFLYILNNYTYLQTLKDLSDIK